MKYIIANWKMYMDLQQTLVWREEWDSFNLATDNKIIVAPPPMYLHILISAQNLELATQDISVYPRGAHTGDIGAFQVKDICRYAIIGHSERKEAPDMVKQKATQCMQNGITPIICFTDEIHAEKVYTPNAVMAWEDPNNISKDGIYNTLNTKEIGAFLGNMRKGLMQNIPLLYGGSVNSSNASHILSIECVDGVLIGNASTKAKEFYEICKFSEK